MRPGIRKNALSINVEECVVILVDLVMVGRRLYADVVLKKAPVPDSSSTLNKSILKSPAIIRCLLLDEIYHKSQLSSK